MTDISLPSWGDCLGSFVMPAMSIGYNAPCGKMLRWIKGLNDFPTVETVDRNCCFMFRLFFIVH